MGGDADAVGTSRALRSRCRASAALFDQSSRDAALSAVRQRTLFNSLAMKVLTWFVADPDGPWSAQDCHCVACSLGTRATASNSLALGPIVIAIFLALLSTRPHRRQTGALRGRQVLLPTDTLPVFWLQREYERSLNEVQQDILQGTLQDMASEGMVEYVAFPSPNLKITTVGLDKIKELGL